MVTSCSCQRHRQLVGYVEPVPSLHTVRYRLYVTYDGYLFIYYDSYLVRLWVDLGYLIELSPGTAKSTNCYLNMSANDTWQSGTGSSL